MMLARWASAVLTLMPRRLATSLLDLPSARSWRISRSRGVRREREDLAGSEEASAIVGGGSADAGGEVGFVMADGVDGGEENAVGFVFEDVAAGAGFDDLLNEIIGFVHGEDEDFGVGGRGLADAASGFDAVEEGHADIEDGDVWFELGGFFDGFAAVGGFGADFPAVTRFQERAKAGANDGMIIRDQDAKRVIERLRRRRTEENSSANGGAGGTRNDFEAAAELRHAFAHAGDADAEADFTGTRRFAVGGSGHAVAVVGDFEGDGGSLAAETNFGGVAAGMALDVGEAFLDDAEESGFDGLRKAGKSEGR